MLFGHRVSGTLKPVFQADLKATKPKEIFQLDIETQGQIPDEEYAIQQLLTLEEKVEDLQILFVETNPDGTITLQFTDKGPGQISFSGLFSLIPALALIAGIVIVGYLLWQVYTSPSSWLIVPLVVVGGIVALYLITGPTIRTVFEPKQVRVPSEEPERGRRPVGIVQQERIDVRSRIKDLDKRINRVDGVIKNESKRLESARENISIQAWRTGQYKSAKDKRVKARYDEIAEKINQLERERRTLEAEKDALYRAS